MRQQLFFLFLLLTVVAGATEKRNFNADWLMAIGDISGAEQPSMDDSQWQRVTLPRAWNEDDAFSKFIHEHRDTVVWYRKHFQTTGEKVFVEFEGVRQAADVYLNGHHLGYSENGVMAFGFDLTPYLNKVGENVLAVRVDNSWRYRERSTRSGFQWNDHNFNVNYGGIVKNVWLHTAPLVYQTLPLYSNLGTTGTYVYATDYDVRERKATVHVESEVRNESSKTANVTLSVVVCDVEGKEVARFTGETATLLPGETHTLKGQQSIKGLHFWSWGYGYLYTVETTLSVGGETVDRTSIVTGFRKTEFRDGKVWLNDRCMMMHGYAQRSSNEWPAVGTDVPAWLSDYTNSLCVESGGNIYRWMHVTPSKQDIESCDRVGMLQAMPAGDAERDVNGRRWEQRTELMRDAIIYNRNSPSILFYEGGNESISREHMVELRQIRDQYDPHGGRAIGSREMLDIAEAEYGGEMLYINKSASRPMWAMEYCRDEAYRQYWDNYSYPYHQHGEGPLLNGKAVPSYNQNNDEFAVELIRRWHEYWQVRPGTGCRLSSGGTKIVFSDTNTYGRSEMNYRTSGVVDAMRLKKDAFYVHQLMWDGWVSPEVDRTYIIGHWNYADTVVKPVYVVSTGDEVELLLNGKSLGRGKRSYEWLFTFDGVRYEPGTLTAVSYTRGKETSRYILETVGKPAQLRLTKTENPQGMQADGSDLALIDVEVVDAQGRRCPLDNRDIRFTVSGPAEWRGGIARRKDVPQSGQRQSDNYLLSKALPVECGITRVIVRSTTTPGTITVRAEADGLPAATVSLTTQTTKRPIPKTTNLAKGETPATPSYTDIRTGIRTVAATAGSNQDTAANSYDDNELSQWESDGERENAWITYQLERPARISHASLKLTGWRSKCYPLEITAADGTLLWKGITPATLGYANIDFSQTVETDRITIRMIGPAQNSDKYGIITELAGGATGELDRLVSTHGKVELRIVEADFSE